MSVTIAAAESTQNNQPRVVKSTDGAIHARDAFTATGSMRGRYLSACATTDVPATNTVTFAAAVTEVTVSVPTTASLTSVMAVFDAPSDAVAAAWLTEAITTSTAADLQAVRILPNSTRTFRFTDGITRIDFRAVGAACPVFIEAA